LKTPIGVYELRAIAQPLRPNSTLSWEEPWRANNKDRQNLEHAIT
jgi:hypothetical protein